MAKNDDGDWVTTLARHKKWLGTLLHPFSGFFFFFKMNSTISAKEVFFEQILEKGKEINITEI